DSRDPANALAAFHSGARMFRFISRPATVQPPELFGLMARCAVLLGWRNDAVSYWTTALDLDTHYFANRDEELRKWKACLRECGPQDPAPYIPLELRIGKAVPPPSLSSTLSDPAFWRWYIEDTLRSKDDEKVVVPDQRHSPGSERKRFSKGRVKDAF